MEIASQLLEEQLALQDKDPKTAEGLHKTREINPSNFDSVYLEKKLKQWLEKYSQNEIRKIPPGNLRGTPFFRLNLFIDYCEMLLENPSELRLVNSDFINFSKEVTLLTKKILNSEIQLPKETKVFADIIVINFPFIRKSIDNKVLSEVFANPLNTGKIVGFQNASVLRVNPSTNFLWYKKFFYNCSCYPANPNAFNKVRNKYFNIYKFINSIDGSGSDLVGKEKHTYCKKCGRAFFHDNSSDIFLECQEVILSVAAVDSFYNKNTISLWLFSDFINSVREGDQISFVAYYSPLSTKHFLEKEFKYGNCIALNMNFYFKNLNLLSEKLFCKYSAEKQPDIKKLIKAKSDHFSSETQKPNYISSFNNNKFYQSCGASLFRFLTLYVYDTNRRNKLSGNNGQHNFTLEFILNISVTQRDFINQSFKLAFFDTTKQIKGLSYEDNLLKSGSICFNTKIFDKQKSSQRKSINEIRKFFRLTKQIEDNEYENNIFNKPLNVFLVFDDLKSNFKVFDSYSQSENFKIYPFFSNPSNFNLLMNYFIANNFNIILIPNVDFLSKLEIELINRIIRLKEVEMENNVSVKLNITFWFCISSKKYMAQNLAGKKGRQNPLYTFCLSSLNKNYDIILDSCDLILNYSSQFNGIRGVEINPSDSNEIDIRIGSTQIEGNLYETPINDNLNFMRTDKIIKSDCQDKLEYSDQINDPFFSAKLVEDYFLVKRELNSIPFSDIFVLLRIACSVSIMRKHFLKETILYPKTIHSLNVVDSLISIMLYEEMISSKKGLEFSSFGNIIPKFLFTLQKQTFISIIERIDLKIKECKVSNPSRIPPGKATKKKTSLQLENPAEFFKEKDIGDNICEVCKESAKSTDDKFYQFLEMFITLLAKDKIINSSDCR